LSCRAQSSLFLPILEKSGEFGGAEAGAQLGLVSSEAAYCRTSEVICSADGAITAATAATIATDETGERGTAIEEQLRWAKNDVN